ncbi:MAG: DUF1926 domain-containing protein [Ignavibacteria bacterium]|nr:DUF1926 domain-containing protein [Ignavibacteria bacterium]
MQFIIALHNHQPVGNFGEVFEEAYAKSYHPFLTTLEKFPNVKVSLHYSGILLEWIRQYRKEFFPLLKKMIEREQVEMLGGGFYEPILCSIPKRDQVSQIKKLSAYLNNHFGVTTKGIWLTERVWEQSLVSSIVEAGIEFTMLDDTHFFYAGLEEKNMRGFFLTEDEGNVLKIFPMSMQMRYAIPFHTIEKLENELREIENEVVSSEKSVVSSQLSVDKTTNHKPQTTNHKLSNSQPATRNSQLLLYGDDGEKFGVWPKTYEHVFEKKWLEQFFEMLEENSSWLQTKNFSETVNEITPLGTIYLPTASYSEMLHWALPTQAFEEYEDFEKQLEKKKLFEKNKRFVRGGYWKNFSFKYSEVNWLHKRMLNVSKQISLQTNRNDAIQKAEEHLHSAQCNDVYWHGVFGGLYLPWLRRPIFQNLIAAEKIISNNENKISEIDLDIDGEKEICVSTPSLNLFLKPSLGGEIAEIDFKPIAHNLSDVVTRRREGYHRKVFIAKKEIENEVATIHDSVKTKEEGIEQYLVEDKFRRISLLDHFFDAKISLENIRQQNWKTISNFAEEQYSSSIQETENQFQISLQRNGNIVQRKKEIPVRLQKNISVLKSNAELEIVYSIVSEEKFSNIYFGSEWNLTLSAGDADDRYFLINNSKPKNFHLRSEGISENVSSLKMIDEWLNIEVEFVFDEATTLWRFPVETVSLSEDGFERVYQGSCLLPLWNLKGMKHFETSYRFSIRKFK